MTDEQERRLEAQSMIGKHVYFKEKGGTNRKKWGTVTDEVYVMVGEYKHLMQQIKAEEAYWDGSYVGYRTGYYTWDATGNQIKWGQYTQFLTEKEYATLLSSAKAKGWPLFDL